MPHETATLAQLLAGPPTDFKPVAYYDKHMDCIRIELRDCSITEIRVDQMLTLLRDNDPSPEQSPLAGVMIKGVKHLFKKWGLPLEGVLLVTTIVDRLLQELPIDSENIQVKHDVQRVNLVAADIELSVNMSQPDELMAA
jgi:hypothetical protein